MPAIKWSDYKVSNTVDGKIVIGKVSHKTASGITVFSEKSEDSTSDGIKAVMQHMNSMVNDETESVSYHTSGFGTLTWRPERAINMWLPWKKKQAMGAPKTVEVEAPRTIEQQVERMKAIGVSDEQIQKYLDLCEEIKVKSERLKGVAEE